MSEEPVYDREQLAAMTKDEVYEIATDLNIAGRSSLTKAQLIDAILATQEGGV
ncbi:Rho termination factor N-terminal domain-containing protein [Exiguobacterium sp. BMC-KP]|uniref:Rho termination factor N-terminal domain-containing protein n=1 Tax=Exiguobacterium sp. BMC-KP TaxID=1684312 RepID=UPI0009E8632D|nr:Rho termination factor N-terminal domain-containing protein [Exiguobacterium sp. BMC-KP]